MRSMIVLHVKAKSSAALLRPRRIEHLDIDIPAIEHL